MPSPIAFRDGHWREVYEDERGQYVMDDDVEPAYGVWMIPQDPDEPDRPIIVDPEFCRSLC